MVQRRLRQALLFPLLVILVLTWIPDTAVSSAESMNVRVSTEVAGLCDSPPWDKVTFHAIVTGGVPPYTHLWDFGDGSVGSTDATPIHHYGQWGRFTANVTVTDSASARATSSASVDILQPPCPLRREPLIGVPPITETDAAVLVGGVALLVLLGCVAFRERIRR